MSEFKISKYSAVFKKVINVLSAFLLIITFLLVIMLVFTRIQGKTPQLFGFQLLRISSSSMSPELEVGDIIISKRVDPATIKAGDVITYNGEYGSYNGKLITHEVITEPYEADGKLYFKTMGIANDYIDPEISEEQIVGIMLRTSPVLSAVYGFFATPLGLCAVLGILALLFIRELFALRNVSKDESDTANCNM
ncbi:MAG: signal peptidase I [Clostridia bacterium]|nr:signal peptidase I [Clostridia bacterium]